MRVYMAIAFVLILCTFSVIAQDNETDFHVFVMDRDQKYALAGKQSAENRFNLVWHFWGDVDLIEDEMGKGLPSDREKALKVLKQRIAKMTESDKETLGSAWRGRTMASDLGISPENMPAVWADGRVFTHVEDLRHVFSRIK